MEQVYQRRWNQALCLGTGECCTERRKEEKATDQSRRLVVGEMMQGIAAGFATRLGGSLGQRSSALGHRASGDKRRGQEATASGPSQMGAVGAEEGTDAGDLGHSGCTGLGWDWDTGGVRDDTRKMLSIGGGMLSLRSWRDIRVQMSIRTQSAGRGKPRRAPPARDKVFLNVWLADGYRGQLGTPAQSLDISHPETMFTCIVCVCKGRDGTCPWPSRLVPAGAS